VYARSSRDPRDRGDADVSIAYQVMGDRSIDINFVAGSVS
jgi:hypothetical protein